MPWHVPESRRLLRAVLVSSTLGAFAAACTSSQVEAGDSDPAFSPPTANASTGGVVENGGAPGTAEAPNSEVASGGACGVIPPSPVPDETGSGGTASPPPVGGAPSSEPEGVVVEPGPVEVPEPAVVPVSPADAGTEDPEPVDAGVPVEPEPEVLPPIPDWATLREAAAATGKLIGAAVRESALSNDPAYREILAREFDYVTPEDSAKWGSLEPTNDSYSWGATDALVDFAVANDQAVKGHALIWHSQMPSWITDSMSADQLRDAMRTHIETTLDHYRGQMRAWDVVNEAVDTATASGYRESIFWQKLGPEFIADSFRWAREADPDVMLLYNDFGIERIGPKSDFTYEMLRDLLDQGVPIDGIGFQSHLSIRRYPSEQDLRDNFQRFADLGLIVNLSEVDSLTTPLPGTQAERWHAQRVAFQQAVSACVAVTGCEAITFWGFSDNYSWLNENSEQDPLIFDRTNQAKPAYEGILHGFAGRSPRRGADVLRNADFSAGADQWSASGGALAVAPADGRAGNAACLSDRVIDTDAIVQSDLLGSLATGGPHSFLAMVRASEASTVEALLLVEQSGVEPVEIAIAALPVEAGVWTRLGGDLGVGFEPTPDSVSLRLQGPAADVELCVTEISLEPLLVD